MAREWQNVAALNSKRYVCGYCSSVVASDKGIFSQELNQRGGMIQTYVYICGHCGQPTYFDQAERQFPGVRFGNNVLHLPQPIEQLYGEARGAMSSQAYTPAVLACRKVLMNVSVSLGAKAGESFVSYVKYLADAGYVPPNGRHWVDHIRTKSNEANHEITLMSKDEAEKLITFVEMMLKFIYELPNVVPAPAPVSAKP
jgi:DNA-directed RNA polymerase subunit RPC12/RpoP